MNNRIFVYAILAILATAVHAQSNTPAIDQLAARVAILECQCRATNALPRLRAGADGFALVSADQAFQLTLRGYVQTDGRFFLDDAADKADDTFTVRRARLILEGRLDEPFAFRLAPDFGGGKTELQDGYLDLKADPALILRAGRTKTPFGLERLQSSAETFFNETALSTALTPNYDTGIMLYGVFCGGALDYAAGIFNGSPDGASADTDAADAKDWVARLMLAPFVGNDSLWLKQLALGIAGTTGKQQGDAQAPELPSFRSAGQQRFFRYLEAGSDADGETDVPFADGRRTRLAPQFYYRVGPCGLLGEYVISEQEVANSAGAGDLRNAGWQLAASWVLTGESPSLKSVRPRRPFDRSTGAWGALELVVRYSSLEIDEASFERNLAARAKSASAAKEAAIGLNWYLTRNAKLVLDYFQTAFEDGAANGRDRPDEKVVSVRAQVAF